MIVDAGADAVVRAHRPRIDLLGAILPDRTQVLLILGCGLDNRSKFLFLCLEVIIPDGDVVLQGLDVILLLSDGRLGVFDVLLRDLAKK